MNKSKTIVSNVLKCEQTTNMSKIKITKEFKEAYSAMEETDDHIFLTGRAGTGKSTLLKHFRKKSTKKFIILAPTGVAALNVKGQTIHSFFGFHPNVQKSLIRKNAEMAKALKKLETIVIDEISMVRADLLDCIDRSLQLHRGIKEPFGGVQMIFIGDLFQLPPVVTRDETERFQTVYSSPYFFSADVMQVTPIRIIELTHVYRQKQPKFIQLLNAMRHGKVTDEELEAWNSRHDPFLSSDSVPEGAIHLTTTNKAADKRNQYELGKLDGKAQSFKAQSSGNLGTRRMPSEANLNMKVGARVMFTNNDSERRWVNGSLGVVADIKKNGFQKFPILVVDLDNGKTVQVTPHCWEILEYQFNGERYEETVSGSYTQYPLTLAWAVTIHKAQGKTFDHILVDLGWGAFAHGQTYVALSRCTSFDGVTLVKPLQKKDVIIDQIVLDFMAGKFTVPDQRRLI